MSTGVFDHSFFRLQQDVMSPLVDAYDVEGNFLLRSYRPPFKLKAEVHLFSDPQEENEVITIKARKLIGRPVLDVIDTATKEVIGIFRAEPLVAIVGSWQILNPSGEQIGSIVETAASSVAAGVVQGGFVPKDYAVILKAHGTVGTFVRDVSMTNREMSLDFSMDPAKHLDRRMGVAAAMMLASFVRF